MQMKRDGLYRTSDLYLAVWLLTNRFELEKLCKDDVSEATLRLVHEAKSWLVPRWYLWNLKRSNE